MASSSSVSDPHELDIQIADGMYASPFFMFSLEKQKEIREKHDVEGTEKMVGKPICFNCMLMIGCMLHPSIVALILRHFVPWISS